MKHHQFAGSVFFSIALVATAASAGVTEWRGESGTSIATGANWITHENGDDIYLVNSPNAAALGEGESFDAGNKAFYVGRGYAKNDQGEWGLGNSTDHDKGATLNINGGTFTSSATVWVGGGFSDYMDCILNISGGEMRVFQLSTGDCASKSDRVGHPKVNAINLSGGTLATTDNFQLGNYNQSTNALLQTGGTFAPGSGEGKYSFTIGHNGKATYDLNGGEFIPPDETHVGRNQGAIGVFNINKDVAIKTTHVGREGGTGIMNVNAGTTTLDVEDVWYHGLNLGWGDNGSKGYLNIAEGAVLETVERESGYANLIRICNDAGTYGEVNVRGTLRDNFANWQGGLLIARADQNAEKGIISEGVLNNWGKTYSKGGVCVAYGAGSKGTLNIYDGIVENNGDFIAGQGAGTTARVIVNGGALVNNSGRIRFGQGSDAKTYVEINGGAVSNLVEHVYIGGEGGNEGTYTKLVMNDGAVYAKQNIYAGAWTSADTVINGGLLEAEDSIILGEWDMAADRTTTLTVNGGTLFAKRILKTYSGKKPTTVLNINGGTFKAKTDTENYFENCGDFVITGDGLGFDTDGHDIVAHYWGARYSGDGGITKKGQGTLTLRGTYALTGKIKVEAGTLVLPENQTIYCEGTEVADGATLELNGSTIIRVTKKIVSSVWTNVSGDGNAANAANWRSHIKYFLEDGSEKEDLSAVLDGVMPAADSDVTIPASSAVRPDMSGLTVRSVTFVATSDVALRGDCSVPEIVKSAKAWYDFDDSASVTMEGGIPVGVANKGTAGNALDLVLYHPEESRRKPAYGLSSHYGRDVMSFTNSYGFVSKNAAGIVGDADRTLVAVSLRIRNTYPAFNDDGTPKEGEYEQQMFPIGLEADMWNPNSGEFRIGQWSNITSLDYDDAAVPEHGFQSLQGLRDISPDEYAIWAMGSNNKTVSGSVMTESAGVENATPVATGGNETKESAKLFIGMRQLYDSPSAGEIAEAMMFDKALSDEELAAVRAYLHTKWFTPFDGTTVPSNIALENGARIDFGGGSWAFDKITGAGTIGHANVTVADSVEPGLVVKGTVDFGDNAGFDFSSIHAKPDPGVIVLLTCTRFSGEPAIKNWNFPSRLLRLRTVDNNDGTVSVVADIRNRAMIIFVR